MFVGINVKCVKCIWAQCSLFYIKMYVRFDGFTNMCT